MKHIDELIKKFKEFKEELNKDVNTSSSSTSTSPAPTPTIGETATAGGTATINSQIGNPFGKEELKLQKNGQWNLNKVDPEENVNIPHPQKPAKMARPAMKNCDKCKENPCTCFN